MPLSKEEILASSTVRVKLVTLQTGESVYLRVLRGTEYDKWQKKFVANGSAEGFPNYRAHWASLVLSDESGERLFTDADASEKLAQLPTTFLDAVLIEGMKLNTINDSVITGLEKNYG